MAIAKMLKMRLISIDGEQDAILNALHKTASVQLDTKQPSFDGLKKIQCDKSEVKDKRERVETALSIITRYAKEVMKALPYADGFSVDYANFMAIKGEENKWLDICDEVKQFSEDISRLKAEILVKESELEGFKPYQGVNERFSQFKNTKKTVCKLGYSEKGKFTKLIEAIKDIPLLQITNLYEFDKGISYCVIYHESILQEAERILSEHAFIRCLHTGDFTASEKIDEISEDIKRKRNEIQVLKDKIVQKINDFMGLKTLSDYYLFELEKLSGQDGFLRSERTFLLEAFVPEEKRAEVETALKDLSGNIYTEFELLSKEDFAPTLMKNKKLTSSFEFVTNLYSAPKYMEFDPNAILGVFFSLFLGFMTADVGYGLLMIIGGLVFAKKQKRETGLKKLALVLAMAGVPTLIFGLLFDSFLGVSLLQTLNLIDKPFLPDPIKDSSVLAGISVPTLLLMCLGMGVIHIMASLFVSAIIQFKEGKIIDGICDGLIMAIFLLGLFLFVYDATSSSVNMGSIPIITMISAVVLGAVTAGRYVKGFGKFTKGFGFVYGLINYMSDILSYARLYGLMLSGAQIAQIVSNQLALPMASNGVGGLIGCILIMLIGHIFNVAMGLLGAFIHGARLQYVEFFSHFYTGDGELFKPLGRNFEHIYLE